MTTIRTLVPLAIEAVDRAAEIVRMTMPSTITAKGDRDMVSDVDLRVERETRQFLSAAAPSVGFLGEEDGHVGDRRLFWALDPVDGTANFVRGIPLCAVSLALVERGRPVLGVIDLPFMGSRFTAEAGGGTYEGSRRLHVSETSQLSDAIVAMGDYAVGETSWSKNRIRLAVTKHLAEQVQRVRMLGSAAVDLVWVADGKLDASITLANKPWDTMAGALMVKEAGGKVVDRDGADYSLSAVATIAVVPPLLDELLDLLQSAGTLPG